MTARILLVTSVVIAFSTPQSLRADAEIEIARALASTRREGSCLLLALVDPRSVADVRQALAEPGCLGSLERYRHLVVDADEDTALRVRFGAKRLPLLVLLDAQGAELGRAHDVDGGASALRALEELGDSAHELASARQRLATNPIDIEALHCLGNYHWNRAERREALSHYERVLSLPARTERDQEIRRHARRRVAEHLFSTHRLSEAESLLASVDLTTTTGDHGDWVALHLALAQRRRGRIDDAIATLSRRLESRPDSVLADRLLYTLAYLERESGRKTAARSHFDELEERFGHGPYGARARRVLTVDSTPRPDQTASTDAPRAAP